MPTSIPVQVAEHQFPSLNKARIYYTGILHRNEVGGHLSEADQQEVMGLMASSHSRYPINDVSITVTRGFFSRPCFASIGPDKQPHYLSIIQSLKKCVDPSYEKPSVKP